MEWNQLEYDWIQMKEKVKQLCDKLTDDDLDYIECNYEKIIGKIQEYYGISKEQAEMEVDCFCENIRQKIYTMYMI